MTIAELIAAEYSRRRVERYDKTAEIAAARKDTDRAPTDAQRQAGNYRKGKVALHGLEISLENPKGSTRSGKSREGFTWSVRMAHDYGYIRRHEGADGDHVDVFIGPHPESEIVFVINQVQHPSRRFDEHKVMMGFRTEVEAKAGYFDSYSAGWKGLGSIVPMTIGQFRLWLREGDLTKPVKTAPSPLVEMFQREFDRRTLVQRFQREFERQRYARKQSSRPPRSPLVNQLQAEFERRGLRVVRSDEPEQYAKDPEFEKKHPRGQPDNAGQFSKVPLTKKDAGKLRSSTVKFGGATYHVVKRSVPKKGYSVSVYPVHEKKLTLKRFTREKLIAYVKARMKFIEADERRHPGLWYDKETNRIVMDIVHVVSDFEEAKQLAIQHNQDAFYDFEQDKVVGTKPGREGYSRRWLGLIEIERVYCA